MDRVLRKPAEHMERCVTRRAGWRTSGNLLRIMARRTFTLEQKIVLARDWRDARARGERQETFASRNHITARRVREFVRECGTGEPSIDEVRRLMTDALAMLQRALTVLSRTSIQAQGDAPHERKDEKPARLAAAQRQNHPGRGGSIPAAESSTIQTVLQDAASTDNSNQSGAPAGESVQGTRPKFRWDLDD
jgi:hypothetical protein